MALVQKEVKAVYMWVYDYTKMQGPCASGYHVPDKSEMESLINIGISLGAWQITEKDNISTYLKLPAAGMRNTDGSVLSDGKIYYWSCSGAQYYGYSLRYLSTQIDVGYTSKSCGLPIRPFKNEIAIPNSNRTVLYQGSGNAGIYHNSSLGLISLSSDGKKWITITDKNLGATNVYNYGDTLSESNSGKFFQRGNNYKFPFTGNVTTSSTKVNASTYGPGNYYSSSTFVTATPRDSSSNENLRGGVTGFIEKKIRPSVQPVSKSFSYTGSDQTWTVPYTQDYIITCKGAGSRSAAGGLAQGTFRLTAGDTLKIMVGQTGNSGNSATYGFGGSANGGSNAAGGGLSGVFTGSAAIAASDSSRALIIGGGAGGSSAGTGGQGGGTTGGTGTGSYGTAGAGGTQTGRGSGGNAGASQFNGGSGSRTYGYGGGGGWRGGNGSIGDGSGDDDKGGGGGSGYVKSTATNVTLTTGGGSAVGYPGSVTIVSVNQ